MTVYPVTVDHANRHSILNVVLAAVDNLGFYSRAFIFESKINNLRGPGVILKQMSEKSSLFNICKIAMIGITLIIH